MAKKKLLTGLGQMRAKRYETIENSASACLIAPASRQNVSKISPLIGGIGALAIKESIAFESAFANVKKTVIGTEEQQKLERGI